MTLAVGSSQQFSDQRLFDHSHKIHEGFSDLCSRLETCSRGLFDGGHLVAYNLHCNKAHHHLLDSTCRATKGQWLV